MKIKPLVTAIAATAFFLSLSVPCNAGEFLFPTTERKAPVRDMEVDPRDSNFVKLAMASGEDLHVHKDYYDPYSRTITISERKPSKFTKAIPDLVPPVPGYGGPLRIAAEAAVTLATAFFGGTTYKKHRDHSNEKRKKEAAQLENATLKHKKDEAQLENAALKHRYTKTKAKLLDTQTQLVEKEAALAEWAEYEIVEE